MKIIPTLLYVLLLAAGAQGATTYYVSSSAGNDSNAGTLEAPWKTLAKVNALTFAPGDVILLKRGDVWREQLIPPSSGTSGSPIVFDNYGSGAPPTITAYQDLPSWTLASANVWSAPVTASAMNYVLFGSIWGQKQSSQAALQRDRDFYFSGNTLFIYSPGNPVTYYGGVGAILLSGSPLVYVNGKSWLQFQHILLNWFDGYGVSVAGASDHLVFANMEADGMVPAGVMPLGFYVNATPAPAGIQFINSDAHLNYDGFRFDGTPGTIALINCRGYANRNGGLVNNGGGSVSYAYSHFYANNIGILNSSDVQGTVTDGGNNIPADTPPAVASYARYPARITFTVDDEGKAAGGADFIDSILPEFTSRNLKLSIAVVTGEQYAQFDIARIQSWFNAGHDINSHSWSHNYWGYGTGPQVFSIRYTGTGTAAALTISANRLTTTITGGPGGENLNLDLTNASYDSYTELVSVINGRPGYTASLIGLPYGHSITLADVSAQDIKSAAYTVNLDKARFVPDEMSNSRAWLIANITGLSNPKVYVYPAGNEDAQTQAWSAAAGYEAGRGGLSMGLGSSEVYARGTNIQDITSLGLSGLHTLSWPQIQGKIAALVFKSRAWGVPYGIFLHPGELTSQEIGYILDGLITSGATLLTNTQLADWIVSTNNVNGTFFYVSAAPGPPLNMRPTGASPVVRAGSNQGAAYGKDLLGNTRPASGSWDIGAYALQWARHGRGSGATGWTNYGGAATQVSPPPPPGQFEAQLPQNWVDTHIWDHAITAPDRVKTIKASGGDYTCTGNTTALQSALDEAESWRIAHDQDTRIDIDPACPAFVVHGTSSQIYMKNLDDAGTYGYGKGIVIRSTNPPRRGVRVGYVVISAISRTNNTVTVTTLDPHGLSEGNPVSIWGITGWTTNFNADENNPFQNVHVIDATHFSFSQTGANETGTVTFPYSLMTGPNTLAQWAAGNYGGFYKIQSDGANAIPVSGQANAVTGNGPRGYLWMNVDGSTPTGSQLDNAVLLMGRLATNDPIEAGWDMGVEQSYIHGCAGTVPTTLETLPHPIACSTVGRNKSAVRLFCGRCWLADSFVDQIVYEGIETHSVGAGPGGIGPQKIVNNRLRGGSTTIHYGGSLPGIDGNTPVDLEVAHNVVDLDPNWKSLSFGGTGSHHWALKNRIEFKTGQRILVWGNRFAWSWHDADQTGSMFLLTIREIKLRNVTVENNLFSHMYGFLQLTGRNDTASSEGISYSTQGIRVRNNMIWGAGDPTLTASPGVIKALPTNSNDFPFTCSASRAGGVTTLTNCTSVNATQTDTEPGDWIRLDNCSDASFNILPAEVISSDPTTAGPLTFAQSGPNASGATCTLHIDTGTPRGVRFENNTIITEGVGSYRNLFLYAGDTNQMARQVTARNNIFVQTTGTAANTIFCTAGGSGGNEGSGSTFAADCFDKASFELHHNLIRPSGNLTQSRYSDWFPRGTENTSHPTTWFPANLGCSGSYTASCPGFTADYVTGSQAVDYHDYQLHANSYYAAGHAGQGDDGKDLGADLAELDSTLVQNVYTCRSDCTNGGANHGPYPHYVSSAQVTNLTGAPASLAFSFTIGGSVPANRTLAVGTTQSAVTFTVSTSGGAWLSASGAGTTPQNVTVSVNPTGLAAGTYNGIVTLTSAQANNSPLSVPVTLTVYTANPTSLTVAPIILAFAFTIGGSNPANQTVAASTTGSAVSFTLSTSGGAWLSASGAGTTPRNVTVSINPSGLSAGTYNGSVILTAVDAANSPLTVPVTLTVSGGGGGGGSCSNSWEAINSPATLTRLRQVAIKNNGHIFVADRVAGFFRSTDGGSTWTIINTGLSESTGWSIVAVPATGTLIASTLPPSGGSAKYWRSTDEGDHWTQIPGTYNFTIFANPAAIAANGNIILGGHGTNSSAGPLWYSTNDGASISKASYAPNSSYGPVGVAADGTIWSGTEAQGIYKSTDNGQTYSFVYQDTGTVMGGDIRAFAFNSTGQILAVSKGNTGRVVRSTDNTGTAWSIVNPGNSGRTVFNDANHILYYGYGTGVQCSSDGGTTWVSFNDGLPASPAQTFSVSPVDGKLYVGLDGPAIYRTVNPVQ